MNFTRGGRYAAALLCTAVALGAPGTSALASNPSTWPARACTGALGAVTVGDDLRVPPGSTCTLVGTRVKGDVSVANGATLDATNATLQGNLDGRRPEAVTLTTSSVGGDTEVVSGGSFDVAASTLRGNVEVGRSTGPVAITDTVVRSDVRFTGNRGGVAINGNRISGNLQCSRNDPPPAGGDNIVRGDREGQCRAL